MASRAPTLAKPKAKPKVTTKKIVAKSSAPQATVALKSVTKTTSKVATKPVPTKTAAVKAVVAKPASKPAKAAATKVTTSAKVAIAHDAHDTLAKPKMASESSAKASGTASFEATPAAKPRRRTKGEIRTRIYWAVFNQSLRRVAVFEFDQRAEAEKRAAKLALSTGEHHFLQKIKALVQ